MRKSRLIYYSFPVQSSILIIGLALLFSNAHDWAYRYFGIPPRLVDVLCGLFLLQFTLQQKLPMESKNAGGTGFPVIELEVKKPASDLPQQGASETKSPDQNTIES
ncbi:MAG: hypothetical protein M3O30_12455 [Planctomycetota bacterium]|nr:hypothetical protein [Planctomycetota bacterium]